MDRNKEKLEEPSKPTINLATLITTPTIPTNVATTATPPADDNTSTESFDIFESWTLINDQDKSKCVKLEDNENHVEILKDNSRHEDENEEDEKIIEEETEEKDSSNNVNNDDFSDGISIISESESVGRISPHPYMRDHLHDLNMQFSLSDHLDDSILNKLRADMENEANNPRFVPETQELRQRRKSSTAGVAENKALQKASQTVTISNDFALFVNRVFNCIVYVVIIIIMFLFIRASLNPNGQRSKSTEKLAQKVNDMELQNNLIRAEIDFLTKRIKYLATLNKPQQQPQYKLKDFKDIKTFKAWSGNGDSLKPVDITKQDLRKPYKCPDGSFVEIANMCMEQSSVQEPSIIDQFGQVVQDLKEQSEAFKTFEKVAEDLQGFKDNPFEQIKDVLSEKVVTKTPTKQYVKNKPIYQTSEDYIRDEPSTEKYNKHPPKEDDSYSSKPHKHHRYDDNSKQYKENKQPFEKDENKLGKEFKKYQDDDNFRFNSKERNEWKTDKINNSKERKYGKDNSKERYNKNFDDSKEDSKERYRHKRKYEHKNDDADSGEWQEKYMRHREQQRKQNEQKYQDNKNWYIKRGDSREHKRSGEKQFR